LKLIENYFKQGILQKTDLLSVQVRVSEIKPIAICKVMCKMPLITWLLLNEDLGSVYKPLSFRKYHCLQTINTSSANRKDIQRWINLLKLSKNVVIQ
jgi:hypothetical protein